MRYFLLVILLIGLLAGPAAPPALATPRAQAVSYVVQPDDTLSGIAARFCTTWQDLYALNRSIIGSNPNVLRWGMVLSVVNRCGGGAPPPAAGGCPQACPQTACPQGPMPHAMGALNGATYTVAAGDTLFSIARRFCTSVDVLARSNGIASPWRIWPGQCLAVPVNHIGPAPTATPSAATPTPVSCAALPACTPPAGTTPTPCAARPTCTPPPVSTSTPGPTFTPVAWPTPTPTLPAAGASLVIDSPAPNAQVGRLLVVSGRATGIQSGILIVQAVDSTGTRALGQGYAPVVGGFWTTVLTINAPAGSTGSIFVYWDRNTTVSARVPVRYSS